MQAALNTIANALLTLKDPTFGTDFAGTIVYRGADAESLVSFLLALFFRCMVPDGQRRRGRFRCSSSTRALSLVVYPLIYREPGLHFAPKFGVVADPNFDIVAKAQAALD